MVSVGVPVDTIYSVRIPPGWEATVFDGEYLYADGDYTFSDDIYEDEPGAMFDLLNSKPESIRLCSPPASK